MIQRSRGVSSAISSALITGMFAAKAENGWSGVKKFQELKPDIVVLDLGMPDISRIEAAKWLSESDPTVPLILFTLLDTEGMESAARGAGICAIVSKTEVWKLLTIETAIRLARISSVAQDHPVSALIGYGGLRFTSGR